jgi:transketolase
MDDIRNFRQLHSVCAGHPENFRTARRGMHHRPAGSGAGHGGGLGLAERQLNALRHDLVDHKTFVIAGDGCLMEGINHEAIGLAGHLKLGRLIVLWDNNNITIDGDTSVSTSEDIHARYISAAGMWWNATATISPTSSARLPKRLPIRVPR